MIVRNKAVSDAEIVQRIEDQLVELRAARGLLEEQISECGDWSGYSVLKQQLEFALVDAGRRCDMLYALIM